jgi:hypothetical protein
MLAGKVVKMECVEEKTPKGFILKIYTQKNTFLVFDRKGGTVYADPSGLQVIHHVPVIIFLGNSFSVRNRSIMDYTLCKVSKGKTILPYYVKGDNDLRYLLHATGEIIDMMPVRVRFIQDVQAMIKAIEAGVRPEAIIIDANITENDVIVIKNRYPAANILATDQGFASGASKDVLDKEQIREEQKEAEEINLNIKSQNPVYLARIHLRDLAITKVRQLLLDFELSDIDISYIIAFIDAKIKEYGDQSSSPVKKLEALGGEFRFYYALLQKDNEAVDAIVENIKNSSAISSFMTLIAKARSVCENEEDSLLMVDYENKLFEKKEQLEKA